MINRMLSLFKLGVFTLSCCFSSRHVNSQRLFDTTDTCRANEMLPGQHRKCIEKENEILEEQNSMLLKRMYEQNQQIMEKDRNIQMLQEELDRCKTNMESVTTKAPKGVGGPVDCKDVYELGNHVDGVYTIYSNGNVGYKVYCDMTTNGGGWTVFQKRFDGSVDFYRTWNEYMNGFGDVNGEYWLGNDKIHELTSQGSQTLRIDLWDQSGRRKYAEYDGFSISDNSTGYKLTAGTYHGNAGDALTYHVGRMFETKDRQRSNKCATRHRGAWWYNDCHHSNLNGLYGNTENSKGINWHHWHGFRYSMKATEMKIRRM